MAEPLLQADITTRLFAEESKLHKKCVHDVLEAEPYGESDQSIIAAEMGGEAQELEGRLRANGGMFVEKWFVQSCDAVNVYEVLLLISGSGTDIIVKKLDSAATSELLPEPNQSASGNDTALVYIFRESNMRLSGQRDVYMDETPIALLPRLTYTTAIAEPGWHLMWGDMQPEWFEFQGGRTYLLRLMAGELWTGSDDWLLDDADRVQQGISALNLEYVVLAEESLAKLRENLDRYERARRRADDPNYPIEFSGLTYKDEPPGLVGLYGLGGRRIFTVVTWRSE